MSPERIDNFTAEPFITGPAEFLVKTLADELANVEQFKLIFGDAIDAYRRMDYSLRELPALRVYSERFNKPHENWFLTGTVTLDVIFPPAIRRRELQQLPDTISAALLQQFRRQPFFEALEVKIPGLNELGKEFDVDKSLGFDMGDDIAPLTQITLNFRLDLRQWDRYLEDSARTVEDPFEESLKNLQSIVSVVQALRDGAYDSDDMQTTVDLETINGG